MGIDDPLLPAAVHLSGPHGGDIIRPAIEQAGGTLGDHRLARLHYRPGHSLVARFRATITGPDGRTRRDTVLAATTHTGPPAGTVVVTADTPTGELTVGVWRWPFDPGLPALERFVSHPSDHLASSGVVTSPTPVSISTVTYRPMERAVLRVTTTEATWYVKVVKPATAPGVVTRHRLLHESGLPVPEVVGADTIEGWMVVTELADPTLRTVIRADADDWPTPETLTELIGQIAGIDTAEPPGAFRRRLADGPHHAALLATAVPAERDRLARLTDAFERAGASGRRDDGFVHGDLHENQLTVVGGRITGLLDIDEAGIGDPLDDIAVPVAHLRHRALTAPNRPRIEALADGVVAIAGGRHRPADLGAAIASVLVGLATTPFRAQTEGWPDRVRSVIDLAEQAATPAG